MPIFKIKSQFKFTIGGAPSPQEIFQDPEREANIERVYSQIEDSIKKREITLTREQIEDLQCLAVQYHINMVVDNVSYYTKVHNISQKLNSELYDILISLDI